ncbi:hypothetical protein BGZ63DRAFT_257062 [Mariannaea sp. PMI_226]|nr:hypothetical protein BGZ63DRAFT_257062 [Mariannaea sp. PMI_226]
MFTYHKNAQALGLVMLLAGLWSPLTNAIVVDICADINTGSTPLNTSIYQSNGLCHDFCISDYAYAITQKNACWCSNYAPSKSTRKDISDCDTSCPGYPSEDCGGGDKLWGYFLLGNVDPSGTQETSSPTTGNTVTVISSATSTSSSQSSSSSDDSSSQTSHAQTVTADGTVKTVFIGPTGTFAGDSSGLHEKNKGLNTGAIAGIAVGVIGAVIVAAGIILFFWLKRRKQQRSEEGFQDDPSIRDSSSGPQSDMAGVAPISPIAASKRNSTLQVDPRMDPFKQGLYVRSGSHESINTLRDDHDYSRRIQAPKVLRATNPDPEI